jgi:hypothetical protein
MTINPLFVAVYREAYPTLPSCGVAGAAMDDFLAALSALTASGPHVSEPYEPYICGICMESGGCSYTMPCRHTACRVCMVQMALNPHLAFSCPFCRTPLDKDNIMNDIDALAYQESIPAFDVQLYPRAPPFEACQLDEGSCYMISRAYHVIYDMNAWETLRNYVPRAEEGFSFTTNMSILEIMRSVYQDNENHSGMSLGYTMRHMHYIAVFGFSAYQTAFSQ